MKKMLLSSLMVAACLTLIAPAGVSAATVAKINVYGMGPRELTTLGLKPAWANSWLCTNGSHSVAVGEKMWLYGTINNGSANSYAWSLLSKPSGSSASLDSTATWRVSMTLDVVGPYILQLTMNGSTTVVDTVYGGNYVGVGSITDSDFVSGTPSATQCANCHGPNGAGIADNMVTGWATTAHAQRGKWDLTGQIKHNGVIMDGPSCMPCHTTGYNTTSQAGGWYELWKANNFTLPDSALGMKMYDTTGGMWRAITGTMKQLTGITCEACHGPYLPQHNKHESAALKTASVNMCVQCHDNPPSQPNVAEWKTSDHSIMTKTHADNISSPSCMQCHSGSGFIKYVRSLDSGATAPSYDSTDAFQQIACATCHDPHNENNNVRILRIARYDTLGNGWKVDFGGEGQLCMNCHHARRGNSDVYVLKYEKYIDPHGGPQADMLAGRNAAVVNADGTPDTEYEGINTHTQLSDACVTCHMASASNGIPAKTVGGHTWLTSANDSNGVMQDNTGPCQSCHGADVTNFDDIHAMRDWDGNGKIEGVETEMDGVLANLAQTIQNYVRARNPNVDSVLNYMGEPLEDSANQVDVIARAAIYDYYFEKNDASNGRHNAKYAFNVLTHAIAQLEGATGVQPAGAPAGFALEGNYPNPFAGQTTIKFSLPATETAQLTIYDMTGAVVRMLVTGRLAAGQYQAAWDGNDMYGKSVTPGVYFYRLQAGSHSATGKMIMMK